MSFTALPIVFQALEEGADRKNLPPGTVLVAENCAMDKARRMTKRWGTRSLAKSTISGTTITTGKRLGTHEQDTTAFDGTSLQVYSNELLNWQTVDRVPNVRVTSRPLLDTGRSASAVDLAIYGHLLVSVYVAGTGTAKPIYVQVEDINTHELVLPPTQVTTAGSQPRVVIIGSYAAILYTTSGGSLLGRTFDLSTMGTLTGPTTMQTGLAASSSFDAVWKGVTLYVVSTLAAGANRVQLQGFDGSLSTSIAAVTTGLLAVGTTYCIDAVAGQGVYVIWTTSSGGGAVKLVTASDTTLAVGTGPTNIYTGDIPSYAFVAVDDATNVLVGYNKGDAVAPKNEALITQLYVGATHAAVANTKRQTNGLFKPSKPWKISSRWYCAATTYLHDYSFGTSTAIVPGQSSCIIEILTSTYSAATPPHRHVATLENQTGWYDETLTLSQPAVDASNNVFVAASFRKRVDVVVGPGQPLGFNVYKASLSDGDLGRMLPIGPNTICVGGAPYYSDGATTMPAAFLHAPMIVSATPGAAASGSMAAGNYQYAAVYTWRDANGVLHRSEPSNIVTATSAANGSIALSIASASISGKQTETTGFGSGSASPVQIELYRTTVGGSILYRLTYEPGFNTITNDPTADSVSITDTRADSSITGTTPAVTLASQAQIYTNTELEEIPPPAFTTGEVHRNRIFGIAADEFTLWASKDVSEDLGIAPGFNEAFTNTFTTRKKALASLDAALVVFGEDDIDLLEGSGPTSAGLENDWAIRRVHSDVGTTNPRSVVVCPIGVLFESRRGIELLDRGLNISFVGQQIEDTLAAYPTITSAVLVAEFAEVRFTCNASNGSSGVVLAWDYLNKIWFTRKYTDAADTATSSVAFVDAALINGVYTLLTAGGQVYRESQTTYLDNATTWVGRDLQIADVHPGGPGGWYRFKLFQVLGTSETNHDLRLSISRDYSTSWEQVENFAAQTAATTVGPLQSCRIVIGNQKAQAVRLRLQDLTPTTGSVGTGLGPIWSGLALQLMQKSGTAKNDPNAQV